MFSTIFRNKFLAIFGLFGSQFGFENHPHHHHLKSQFLTPPCLRKSRFSTGTTGSTAKSRPVLESWQNFEEDEVGLVESSRFFDPILGDYLPKNPISTKKIEFWRKIFFSRSSLKSLMACLKMIFLTFYSPFGHNLALKKAREKELYCRFWGILDHCVP